GFGQGCLVIVMVVAVLMVSAVLIVIAMIHLAHVMATMIHAVHLTHVVVIVAALVILTVVATVPAMIAVVGHVHAHIAVSQHRCRVHFRNLALQRGIGSKRASGKTCAVVGLGKQGISAISFRLHNHIVGFSNRNAKFIHRDWLDILTICRDHGHFQPGNAHIENAHGGAVDDAQTHFFTGLEQPQ